MGLMGQASSTGSSERSTWRRWRSEYGPPPSATDDAAGGQPGLRPDDPRHARAAVRRYQERPEGIPASGRPSDLQPSPSGRLRIRRRDAVARPPARAGGRGGRRPGHGPPRQHGADADRRPEDARRGLDCPTGGPGWRLQLKAASAHCSAYRHRCSCRSIASGAANHGGLLSIRRTTRRPGRHIRTTTRLQRRTGNPRQRFVASKLHVSC
jgi:hypothetical protein